MNAECPVHLFDSFSLLCPSKKRFQRGPVEKIQWMCCDMLCYSVMYCAVV